MEDVEPSKITASPPSNSLSWDDIDLAERYLVCGMFEDAADLASSILTRIHDNVYENTTTEIVDMIESTAMVLVQAWRAFGRTSDLMNELECYFRSVTEIPIQVVLHSACIQVSSGNPSGVCKFLEKFLAKWQFENERYYALTSLNLEKTDAAACAEESTLEVAEYLEAVEFYAFTLLAGVLNDVDHAILWIEKAQLPEESRQDFLRRLISLNHMKSTSSKQDAISSPVAEEPESYPLSKKEIKQSDKATIVFSNQGLKQSIWSRLQNITARCYKYLDASNGRIFLGCLIFLTCYFIRKKRETIMRILQRRALALKQAIADIWQLAFSYQVNPLAAVQSLPAPPANRSR
ncbi:LOW QUALITY PROTEIN: protein APEM9 [Silene latifolia]|uniref:LOW QUALITY PROTEIN: protein APEM9 n=1 Tax=Silene latifolia TaxID=37657 RepID=UPI003D76C253